MQNKHDEGFSLIEILVAIVILAAFVVPICSSLVMTNEMNNRTDALMQAQLDVSSAVEMLMAEGIPNNTPKTEENGDYGVSQKEVQEEVKTESEETKIETKIVTTDRFPNVIIKVEKDGDNPWFHVTVISNDGLVDVTTSVRAVTVSGGGQ